MARVAALDRMAVIATAPGRDCDFVSRFFAPSVGHSRGPRHRLGPLHARALLVEAARQDAASSPARSRPRGGELWCEDRGERVSIAGRCVRYLEGTIELPGA